MFSWGRSTRPSLPVVPGGIALVYSSITGYIPANRAPVSFHPRLPVQHMLAVDRCCSRKGNQKRFFTMTTMSVLPHQQTPPSSVLCTRYVDDTSSRMKAYDTFWNRCMFRARNNLIGFFSDSVRSDFEIPRKIEKRCGTTKMYSCVVVCACVFLSICLVRDRTHRPMLVHAALPVDALHVLLVQLPLLYRIP